VVKVPCHKDRVFCEWRIWILRPSDDWTFPPPIVPFGTIELSRARCSLAKASTTRPKSCSFLKIQSIEFSERKGKSPLWLPVLRPGFLGNKSFQLLFPKDSEIEANPDALIMKRQGSGDDLNAICMQIPKVRLHNSSW